MRLPSTDRGAIDKLKNHFSKVQIADRDEDLDRDPYTAGAWNFMTLSNGATGTIDWVATFGLPEIPKMVCLYSELRDVASAGGDYYIDFLAKATTGGTALRFRCDRAANDNWDSHQGLVAVADNGTTYYAVVASGVNTMDVRLRVPAWTR